MSSIMMDKWSIITVLQHLCANIKTKRFEHGYIDEMEGSLTACLNNFLLAVVLWDEIWSFNIDNNYSWMDIFGKRENLANTFQTLIHQPDASVLPNDLLSIYRDLSEKNTMDSDGLVQRGIAYQQISSFLGVPFLGHPLREGWLLDHYRKNIFTRVDIINRVDKELITYCEKINAELGRDLLKFNYPVLINFIRQEAGNNLENQLEVALELRDATDVVAFREQMFYMEQIVAQGNIQAIKEHLDSVSELAKDITTKRKKEISLGEFILSLFPPYISLSVPIKIPIKKTSGLHITFINRLLEFGLHGRGNLLDER
jgi:hypothetical protein